MNSAEINGVNDVKAAQLFADTGTSSLLFAYSAIRKHSSRHWCQPLTTINYSVTLLIAQSIDSFARFNFENCGTTFTIEASDYILQSEGCLLFLLSKAVYDFWIWVISQLADTTPSSIWLQPCWFRYAV
ncbi:hypothetical protein CVS40_0066 [Lucilia cuprina]|nr:hypothetical protein CVS40_0066 [Lucilia cuprina]